MLSTRLLGGCILALAASSPAQMAGVYTINPTWPASSSNFTSLQGAVSALASGGVAGPCWFDVYDDAGPYVEVFPFTTASVVYAPSNAGLMFAQWTGVSATNRVTFRAAAGESPVIDATGLGMGVYWNGADYVTLEGFEVKGAAFDAISLYSEASVGQVFDAEITGCRIHDCGGAGVCIYGNTPNPTNTLVQNCFLWHLQTTNAGGFNTTARFGYISTRRAAGSRVIDNTFYIDTTAGTSFCAIGSYTSSAAEVTFAEVRNNVFVKVAGAGKPLFRFQTVSGATNPVPLAQDANCYWDLTSSPLALYGVSAGSTANLLLDWQTATGLDPTSIAQDPMLLDPANGDLHLGASSPCIVVLATGTGPTVDIDGQPRLPIGIGADQFSSATMSSVGTGCVGSNGTPVLYSRQWPFLGNANFAVLANGGPIGAFNFMFLSLGVSATPIAIGAGCTVYLRPSSLVQFGGPATAGPDGSIGRIIPLPNNAALVGLNLGIQEMFVDGSASLGLTLTNALALQLGF